MQRHEVDTVGESSIYSPRRFQSKAGFADATGTDQRQQAAGRVREEFGDVGEFPIPANEVDCG